nr:VOC family protein [Diaminobutyricimonas aerilata]
MELKLEVVILPVTDVDRAKAFYQRLDFRLDADFVIDEGYRIVQLTPPGSSASIIFGTGTLNASAAPVGGLLAAVPDIEAARADIAARGIEISEIFHEADPFVREGAQYRIPGAHPERASYSSFATFSDPDGNSWLLQEITDRLPGR